MIYGISDLHLSFFQNKTMDKFGENWVAHHIKIEKNWRSIIREEDTILLCGDISWAMRVDEAMPDLEFVASLPGKKIIISGNHDYYFKQLSKFKDKFDNIKFLKNDFCVVEGIGICGTRGWTCPNSLNFSEDDQKIYLRELQRLRLSLDKCAMENVNEIYVMLHFSPTNEKKEISGFIELAKEYNVKKIIYGHLHGKDSFESGLKGFHYEIEFILTSCDYLDFKPILINVGSSNSR